MSTILSEALSDSQPRSPSEILDVFFEWIEAIGLELYEAQEEALFHIFDDKHVILNTPTGSGKSLVALAMHFYAASQGRKSFYTSPIKALVSEKFFSLCNTFGAENVGMMTGDASVNTTAPIVCCTAEVLANMALREGAETDAPCVIMDEFHYYSDRDRGWAWQVPLLILRKTRFLLMSATLGDTDPIVEGLARDTGRETGVVTSDQRPVPLEYKYVEASLHETIEKLTSTGLSPTYIVNFSQRECAELAQACTSINFIETEEKRKIRDELKGFRFESPYGKDVKSFCQKGIGIHHAGLLPRYRLLVEKMAQEGKLAVIIGTDTLGVGINVPIRSVLFTRLYKYDGHKTDILPVRDFKQIAGRAGRKGFDERGYVYCQAPAHVVENKKLEAKAKRGKKVVKSSPPKGYVAYDEDTFRKLSRATPEVLEPRFELNHGILVQLLQRDNTEYPKGDGYRALIDLIAVCHQNDFEKSALRRDARMLFRALLGAGLIEVERNDGPGSRVIISEDLQDDFSLFHALSLYLVEALENLNMNEEEFPLNLLTLVESILENPRVILYKQEDKQKSEALVRMKADGMDYEDRIEELDKITYPKPQEEFLYETFNAFREEHPWVRSENVRPKSIARDMIERYMNFSEYVNELGLSRSEGVLLRYLSQVYKALVQNVPEGYKTDAVIDVIAYLRTVLGRADSSLLDEWEGMSGVEQRGSETLDDELPRVAPIWTDQRFVEARIRTEAHELLRAFANQEWESAAAGLRNSDSWDEEQLESTLAPFFESYGSLKFDHQARYPKWSRIEKTGPKTWTVTQTMLDDAGDNFWYFEATVDFEDPPASDEPWLTLLRVLD